VGPSEKGERGVVVHYEFEPVLPVALTAPPEVVPESELVPRKESATRLWSALLVVIAFGLLAVQGLK
jgi:hypothetical protein